MCSATIIITDTATASESETSRVWPEEPSSSSLSSSLPWWRQVYNRWTYSYMNEILSKGSEQARKNGPRLSAGDLYPVPDNMTAKHLSQEFRKYYNNNNNSNNFVDENDEYTTTTTSSSSSSLRRFLWTLWHLAAPTFVPAGFCQLLSVLCQVVLPLLVRQLLALLENHPGETIVQQGMPYAILMFVTSVVNAFGNHRHRHLAMKTGVILRAASVQQLYQHVLHLTPAGREGLTSGQVTNLIAVDTQKLFEVTQEAHLIWALPLSVILVTALLLWIMGPTTLIGIAVLVLFLPIVERITSGIHKIRKVRVKFTDQRVEIVNSMLQGIKVTKLNNYEANYLKRVTEARDLELMHLKKELAVWALSLLVTVSSPVIATAATFATYVLVDDDNILTAAKTFSVLLLFAALRFPINYAGRLIGKAAQAISASQRIARFLERETREFDQSEVEELNGPDDAVLSLVNAGFSVATLKTVEADKREFVEESSSKQNFRVGEFNLELKKGEVLAVCGPVASGKSTFVNGIIDEVPALASSVVTKRGRAAYVPQTPFILNATFRENILFGRPFQKNLYDRVVEACCLRTDIEQLGEAKDLTEIGERGVTLSGGQKQRVALARAAYSQPDLVLLDDPLSALDAGTAKAVFEQLLKSENALFATAATVLVTHASHFLNQVDRVIIIAEGVNRFHGTWKELLQFESEDETTRSAVEFIRSSVQEGLSKDTGRPGTEYYENTENASEGAKKAGKLMSTEEREFGLSSVRVWVLWFRRAGGWYFLGIQILLMALDRFVYVAVEYWLARWTQGAEQSVEVFGIEFPPQTDGLSAQYKYLTVFASLLCTSVFFTALRSEWAVTGGSRASRKVFAAMLQRVLYAPMTYFQTTPMGRILNRFTFDMEVIDVILTQVMSMFLISCSWYVAGVVLMCCILPWMILSVLPVTAAFWCLLLHYRRSATDLQRLDALSRSPIQAMISEGLDGSSTIRVFRQEQTFGQRFFSAVDRNSSAMLNFVSSQRWLGIRIELLGSVIVLCSSVLVVALNGSWKIEPGLVGLLINWSSNFTITLGFLIETFGEVEASITAIERVDAMSRLPQEKSMVTDDEHKVAPFWPEHGHVDFERVCLRYREGLPLALNNLSFTIPAGKRCGVVGRTGAGKSSLTVALFRLEEIESGCIRLDGVDLANLGLSDVRGRPTGMKIIPQDPFLTGVTLRECLDPFAVNSDQDVLSALQAVRLAPADATTDLLNTPLEEGGSNYSVGERQLLNLAAALLSKPKVLVCDEATASIDYESDAFVQRMLRERFQNTTLITVAHRLNTIMDYDLILVMDQGQAAEMGSPKELLSKEDGAFSKLVDATGEEASRALRAMVGS